jgi:transcription initiation factor TFIIIB Brf1 subunit/transcription initiation factor TFIIB
MLNSSESNRCSVCGRMYTFISDPESGEVLCGYCGYCGLVISENDIDDIVIV